MTKIISKIIVAILLFSILKVQAQEIQNNDTVKVKLLDEVTITATKGLRLVDDIPGRVDIIGENKLKNIPAHNADDLLRTVSGVNVNRTSGNFTMRPSVTIRNLGGDEQGRTLVLMNGIPMNTSDEGGVNWNRIGLIDIQKIEVLKGPGSSIYGSNAMGGVVNIITSKPVNPFEVVLGTGYGTFNSLNSELYLGGKVNSKLYWSLTSFYESSDGYNNVPESKPEYKYSVNRYLREGGISAKLGYAVNDLLNIDFQYDLYRDKRGEGEKIQAPDGEYRNFNTDFANLKISGQKNKFEYQFVVFINQEAYYRLDERIKGTQYTRFDAISDRVDNGTFLNSTYSFTKAHILSFGAEYKNGSVNGGDYYKTSEDIVLNKGSLRSSAVYIQDEIKTLSEKLNIITCVRIDNVLFHNGFYEATGNNVNYWTDYAPTLSDNSWFAFSPKAAIKYKIIKNISAYISFSRGFRASILDDLCRSGWMWVGPKIANPNLGPEYLDNYEAGISFRMFDKLSIEPTIYYSLGNDFLYYVATGDTISNRPMHRRENISKVEIKGFEMDLKYNLNPNIYLWANYTLSKSKILEFNKMPELQGKALKYSPANSSSLGFIWNNRIINTSLLANFKDKQYVNDINSLEIDSYFTIDLQLSRSFIDNKFTSSISIQDIFDNHYMETIDYLSPGRIITIKLKYKFGQE